MIPNAAEVTRRRWTVTTCLRVGSFGLFIAALLPVASWIQEGIRDGDLFDLRWYMGRILAGAVLLLMGLAFFFLAGLVARLLVPIRRHAECPACRHRIEGVTEPKCTECGLVLTPEFLGGQTPLREPVLAGARRVVVRRDTVASIFRVIGVLCVPIAALYLVSLAYSIYMWLWGRGFTELYEFGYFLTIVGQTVVWLGVTVLFLAMPRRLARFCVPFSRKNREDPIV